MKPIKITGKDVTQFGQYQVVILPKGAVRSLQSGTNLTLITGEYKPNQLSQSPASKPSSLQYKLSETPLLEGKRKTLGQWTEYANQNNTAFGAFHDYIRAPKQNNLALIENIRSVMKPHWVICSNQFNYFNPDTLDTEVTIYPNLKAVKPISKKLNVEVHSDWDKIKPAIEKNENDRELFRFLMRFPKEKSSKILNKKILDSMEALSGRGIENQLLWTPDKDSRKSVPVRALRLSYDNNDFLVDCVYFLYNDGCAF